MFLLVIREKFRLITDGIPGFFLAGITYLTVSVFFLFGLITSSGNAAQQDWGIPLTAQPAFSNLHSLFFAWQNTGFGGITSWVLGLTLFSTPKCSLAPLGFFGGYRDKGIISFSYCSSGISAYILCRSFA